MERIWLISLFVVLLVSLISISCGPVATPPAAPTGLLCEWVSSSRIDLSWDASSGATVYHIYRCTGASCTPTTQIHTESTTSWSDTGLTPSTTYCYALTAYNEVGESGYSSIVSCTTYDTYNPDVAWNKTFGGSDAEFGDSVEQTSDGGYIISATRSYGPNNSDVWLIKTDSSGNVAWNKTFGGSDAEFGSSVQQTSDGGYVISARTNSCGAGDFDVWLIKADSSGNVAWNKTFGGSDSDYGSSVRQTSDGGYIISGSTSSSGAGWYDIWLIKTDSSGNEMWNKTFGGSDPDVGSSVQQTSDGGYIICGSTSSYGAGNLDVWLIKTDPSGNEIWNKVFGGSETENGFSARQTSDGGYIICGYTESYGAGDDDFWLIETDPSGNEMWNKTFGGSDSDHGSSVQQTLDGGYIISGFTDSYGAGSADLWLIKTDPSGNEMWNKTFGGSDPDYANSVRQTRDGGYIISGSTGSYGTGMYDVWLVKVTVSP